MSCPPAKGYLRRFSFCSSSLYFGQVVSLQVIQKLAATAGYLQKTTARVEVLAVEAQMLGQMIDASGEQRDPRPGLRMSRCLCRGILYWVMTSRIWAGMMGMLFGWLSTSVAESPCSFCAARCHRGINRGASRRHRSNPEGAGPDEVEARNRRVPTNASDKNPGRPPGAQAKICVPLSLSAIALQ